MTRILIFGMSANCGGIETFLFNYFKRMNLDKMQFYFVKTGVSRIAFEDEIVALNGKIVEFNPCGIRKGYKKNRNQWLEFYRLIKPDVIHYNTVMLTTLCPVMYAKQTGIRKIIVHSHSNGFISRSDICVKFKCKINKYLIKKYATDLWGCSKEAGEWMFGTDCKVIPNAIDLERFRFNETIRQKIRQTYKIENKIVFCNIGRLSYQKNQLYLVDIIYELSKLQKNICLFMIGQGQDEEKLREKVKQLKLEKHIILTGLIDNVEDYLSASDYFIFPSVTEGLGIALLEAQACGLYCFASDKVIPKEVNVTGGVYSIPLEKGPKYWANIILSKLYGERIPEEKVVKLEYQYNIERCVLDLQREYMV